MNSASANSPTTQDQLDPLLAVSALDGRYAGKVAGLTTIVSNGL